MSHAAIDRDEQVVLIGDLIIDIWWQVEAATKNVEHAAMAFKSLPAARYVKPGGVGIVAEILAAAGFTGTVFSTLDTTDDADAVNDYLLACKRLRMQHVLRDRHYKNSVKTRYLNSNGHILVRHDSEPNQMANLAKTPDELVVGMIQTAHVNKKCAVVSDYGKGGIKPETRRQLVSTFHAAGTPVYVDAKPQFLLDYTGADIIKVNRAEFQTFVNANYPEFSDHAKFEDAVRAVAVLLGAGLLIVTDGASGVWWNRHRDKNVYFEPVPQVHVAGNCVGAGDAFFAGLIIGLSEHKAFQCIDFTPEKIRQAINFGLIVAGQRISAMQYGLTNLFDLAAARAEVYSPALAANTFMALPEFIAFARKQRALGRSVVFTNGCFDLIHSGHVKLLNFARTQGDILIVAVDSDSNVRQLKGEERPIHDEATRAGNIAAMEVVNAVCLFNETDPVTSASLRGIISKIQPAVLVKGAEYADKLVVGAEDIAAQPVPGRVALCPMAPNKSTTFFVNKMRATKA